MKSITIERPLAATLILGALLTTAGLAVGSSWADLNSAIEERDAQTDLLARGVAASKRAQMTSPSARLADPFVPGATETLAAAQVDAMMRSAAADAGCALLSSRAEAKADTGGKPDPGALPGRIEDQVVFEGENEALQAILVRLEAGAPAVLVDDLTIEPADTDAGNGGDPVSPRLRMSLTVSAYWHPPKP